MTPTLTPRQHLKLLIENDARNVRDTEVDLFGDARLKTIRDCAVRLFDARRIDTELERRAEENLRNALAPWLESRPRP